MLETPCLEKRTDKKTHASCGWCSVIRGFEQAVSETGFLFPRTGSDSMFLYSTMDLTKADTVFVLANNI